MRLNSLHVSLPAMDQKIETPVQTQKMKKSATGKIAVAVRGLEIREKMEPDREVAVPDGEATGPGIEATGPYFNDASVIIASSDQAPIMHKVMEPIK